MDTLFESVLGIVDAAKTGQALVIVSAVILLLTQLLKQSFMGSLMSKLPHGLRALLPVGLGLASSVVSHLVAGMTWVEALVAGFGGGYIAVSHYEVVGKAAKKALGK